MKVLTQRLMAFCALFSFFFALNLVHAAPSNSEVDFRNLPNTSQIQISGIYQFSKDVDLVPLYEIINDQIEFNGAGETIHFEKDEPIYVKFKDSGDVELHLLLSEEEHGMTPEVILLSKKDFEKSGLIFHQHGDVTSLYAGFVAEGEYEEAGRRGRFQSRRKRLHYRGAGGCVAYVIRAIGWKGGRTGNGWQVTSTLKKAGWVPVNCKNAPLGSVASWRGGRHGMGHTAYREKRGWCYDLGCHDPGKRYRLIECVMRPGSKVAKSSSYKKNSKLRSKQEVSRQAGR